MCKGTEDGALAVEAVAEPRPPHVVVKMAESGTGAAAPLRKTQRGLETQHMLLGLVGLLTVHSLFVVRSATQDGDFDLQTAPKAAAATFVWASGWLSAACSGFGVAPFLLVSHLSPRFVGVCNAVAAGVMIAASAGLVAEGALDPAPPGAWLTPMTSVIIGFNAGIGFIKATEALITEVEPDTLAELKGNNMRRVLVVMAAMTVHAFSEGVGIGVSHRSQSLGGVVSASLAIHNIPEGLACAIVLIPRGFSLVSTVLLCIFSSLPQPLLAVPSFLLVDVFKFVTPFGCAFAAGAMTYVALFELLKEAQVALSRPQAVAVSLVSMCGMGLAQGAIKAALAA